MILQTLHEHLATKMKEQEQIREEIENKRNNLACTLVFQEAEKQRVQKHDENTDNVKGETKTNSACTRSANVAPLCFPQGHSSSRYGGTVTHIRRP